MAKKVIILITGHMGTGKSTLAEQFLRNPLFKKGSFAAPLKEMMNPIIKKIDPKFLEADNKHHIRVGYQWLGNLGRLQDPNYWLTPLKNKIDKDDARFFVIDDCRFINELHAFDDGDKYIVYKIRMSRDSIFEKNDDPSETGLDAVKDSVFDFISKGVTEDWEELQEALLNTIHSDIDELKSKPKQMDIHEMLNMKHG